MLIDLICFRNISFFVGSSRSRSSLSFRFSFLHLFGWNNPEFIRFRRISKFNLNSYMYSTFVPDSIPHGFIPNIEGFEFLKSPNIQAECVWGMCKNYIFLYKLTNAFIILCSYSYSDSATIHSSQSLYGDMILHRRQTSDLSFGLNEFKKEKNHSNSVSWMSMCGCMVVCVYV